MNPPLILVVDDKPENRYLLRALLEGHGFQVAEAAHGDEALTRARKHRPDLAVSDILMPVMDGFALCREWRLDDDLKSVPFVFYTATYTDRRDRDFALALGADEFIAKPKDPAELIEEIRALLARGTTPAAPGPAAKVETVYLRQYNEALVRKLETKMEELRRDVDARRKAEERLRASVEHLQDVAANLPGAIYQLQTGRHGRLEVPYMSSGCEALFEQPLSGLDFTGLFFDHMHAGDRGLFEYSLAAAIRRFEHWALEFRILLPGGRVKWLRASANPRRQPDGRVVWNGVLLDISAQKEAEEERRKSDERLHLLIKNSSDAISVVDAAGALTYVSPAEKTLSGFTPEEMAGKTIADVIHPDDLARAEAALRTTVAHPEKTHRLQCRHCHKTRGWMPVEIVGQSFLDEPAVQGIIVSVRDITERMAAEEEMARQLDELRRWHSATLGREDRVAELKREVNELAAQLGRPPPYPSAEAAS